MLSLFAALEAMLSKLETCQPPVISVEQPSIASISSTPLITLIIQSSDWETGLQSYTLLCASSTVVTHPLH